MEYVLVHVHYLNYWYLISIGEKQYKARTCHRYPLESDERNFIFVARYLTVPYKTSDILLRNPGHNNCHHSPDLG